MLQVKRDQTFGQLYLQAQNGIDIRIPRQYAAAFHTAAGTSDEDIRRLREGQTVTVDGNLIDFMYLAG